MNSVSLFDLSVMSRKTKKVVFTVQQHAFSINEAVKAVRKDIDQSEFFVLQTASIRKPEIDTRPIIAACEKAGMFKHLAAEATGAIHAG